MPAAEGSSPPPQASIPTDVDASEDEEVVASANPSKTTNKKTAFTDREAEEGKNKDSSDEEQDALEMERMEYGTVYQKTTKDKTQPAKFLDWELVDPSKLSKTCVREKIDGHKGTEYRAQLINGDGWHLHVRGDCLDSQVIYKMWKHLLPPTWIDKMVEMANKSLIVDPIDKNYRKTTAAEMEVVQGEALGAAVMGLGMDKCFAIVNSEESLFPPVGFGQYGVSKNRALILLRAAHLSDGPQKPAGAKDTHWFIDGPLEQFNDHMQNSFRPSYLGTMDETGPAWHGEEGEDDYNKCPQVTIVLRKPEPVCAEFNDIACAMSRVMVKIEFEKGKEYHASEKYMDVVGSYNAAMTTRLVQPFANANAACYGDSRFGSVKAAYHSKKIHDVHTAFDIKTATGLFPRKELVKICPKKHGSIVVMRTTLEGIELFAIGQRRGPSVHTFLSTFGTFVNEIPSRFKTMTNLTDAPWLTPAILNKVTLAQPAIDAINRQLFDQLGMQYHFRTKCFETRFANQFMLPLTYVNAINATKYFFPQFHEGNSMSTKTMLMRLATCMVRNNGWANQRNGPQAPPAGGAGTSRSGRPYQEGESVWRQARIDGGPPTRESPGKHTLILLSQLEGYKGAKQQRCWECNALVSWCCARCSTAAHVVPLHPTVAQASKRHYCCLANHRVNPAGGYKVTHEKCTGTSSMAKRRRRVPFEFV